MTTLAEMIARVAQPGRILWLGLRPARREGIVAVPEARIDAAGLLGDHGRAGKRAVTLLQAEHLPAIAAYLGRDDIPPEILRRNIVVAGLNLAGLKERPLRIGTALLRPTVICAPCSRMEAALGHGGYAAVRGHGGWCAEVLEPGRVALGDRVRPEDEHAA
ncbi:MOSC domain protein [Roseivivax sp. THAF40]|uniref:MOSC domain-containing protein n=1 Tax=unclassified Roseivivax TaxID=2639302 RepID=UPI001267D585|nr:MULTISPECIES: MOSC domain-containing protein [unclassified Roseivivax]QFS84057.1 MOSC domain protein [Roseivivax sp. THAF197b]QFT47884.1 MOSC domain protein [Roseivivax sp. THAF40]